MAKHPTRPFGPDDQTPTALTAAHVELMHQIGADEGRAATDAHKASCQESGPLAEVWRAIHEIRKESKTMSDEQAEHRGAMKAQARNVTIVVAAAAVLQLALGALNYVSRAHPSPATSHPTAQVQP